MTRTKKIPRDDGGPAFPQPGDKFEDGDRVARSWDQPGMKLRDYFAGQALAGLLACPRTSGEDTAFAKDAYEYADAMIAERSK